MKENNSYSQFLKHENELTKLKIQAEFGFQIAGESSLNPAIENIWLKQILDFERAMVNSTQITVREKLGYPKFKTLKEIPADELNIELQKAMEILGKKNMVVDVLAEVSDADLYTFITEELMAVETDSTSPPNMLTCYIYEEFHPNHDYDVRNRANEFMHALEGDDVDFSFVLHAESDDEVHDIRFQNLKRKLRLFKEAFDEVKVKTFEVKNIEIGEEISEMIFDFELSVLPAESKSRYTISGEGKFRLKNVYDWWSIVDVEMKGVI